MSSRQPLANAIRALSMDAVQRANSGHPGMPMGMADIAEVLWNDFLQHNPANPNWLNRDRFILSNGHGSMLQYALLHLSGYDLTIEDLKQFRQLHSRTPGHPELGYTPGVETTTGPLGQGLANAVGMALAERTLAALFNRPDHSIIDHYTYVFLGDGCLMEGISHEACSFAGNQGLGKLIAFWDDNGISIDGHVEGWFSDNTPQRFKAYGWHVIPHVDGHDPAQIHAAIQQARAAQDKPTLICCKTIIGFGAPEMAGTHLVHGAALGAKAVAATRANLAWPYAPFEIPPAIYASWDARARGAEREQAWQATFTRYQAAYPELATELLRRLQGNLPTAFTEKTQQFIQAVQHKAEAIATRKASQNAIINFSEFLPELLGGSADLTSSNLTNTLHYQNISAAQPTGNYIYYGVREFGMSAIMNGIAVHGGFIPFGGTFLTFSDYARNALRMAAIMRQRVIFVFTHDSLGVGEDGPTHQPIEHAAMLRLTPHLSVWRPCDATESAVAWQQALSQKDKPSCLLFSRQALPHQPRDTATVNNIARGGYILSDCTGVPQIILIATGSEVQLAMEAAQQLQQRAVRVRVVSMPSTDHFDQQEADYKEAVLPQQVSCRIAIEAGAKDYWYKYVGLAGQVIGMDRYGESAPADALFNAFGFTVENIVHTATQLLKLN